MHVGGKVTQRVDRLFSAVHIEEALYVNEQCNLCWDPALVSCLLSGLFFSFCPLLPPTPPNLRFQLSHADLSKQKCV